jgi:RNA polymerase sigma-70 factor (ECF subfamily)
MIGGPPVGHISKMAVAGPTFETATLATALRRDSGVRPISASADQRLHALVEAHFDFVWRSLRRLGLSSADSDDAAQQVFWVAARKLDTIELGRERAFLFGTALRVASDVRRAAARRPETSGERTDVHDPQLNPEELTERRQARALLDEILDSMPMDMRTVFVLFELEELGVNEIAVLCEIPVGTVASRLRRARQLFRSAAKRYRAKDALRGGGT